MALVFFTVHDNYDFETTFVSVNDHQFFGSVPIHGSSHRQIPSEQIQLNTNRRIVLPFALNWLRAIFPRIKWLVQPQLFYYFFYFFSWLYPEIRIRLMRTRASSAAKRIKKWLKQTPAITEMWTLSCPQALHFTCFFLSL